MIDFGIGFILQNTDRKPVYKSSFQTHAAFETAHEETLCGTQLRRHDDLIMQKKVTSQNEIGLPLLITVL